MTQGGPPNEYVLLTSKVTGLPKDSVANISQLVTLDKSSLSERIGKLSKAKLWPVYQRERLDKGGRWLPSLGRLGKLVKAYGRHVGTDRFFELL